jgi:hypothetical protein
LKPNDTTAKEFLQIHIGLVWPGQGLGTDRRKAISRARSAEYLCGLPGVSEEYRYVRHLLVRRPHQSQTGGGIVSDKKVVTEEMKRIITVAAKAFFRDNPEEHPTWEGWYREFCEQYENGGVSEAFLRNVYEWNNEGIDPGLH